MAEPRITDVVNCPKHSDPVGMTLRTERRYCLSCDYANCPERNALIEIALSPLKDVSELNLERLSKDQLRVGFCPIRSRTGKYCNANKNYCLYASECPVRQFPLNTRTLRYEVLMSRKGGTYGLVINETDPIKLVRVTSTAALPNAKRVLRITHRIKVVADLVPVGDINRKKDLEVLVQSFKGTIIDTTGRKIKLSTEWLDKAEIGTEVYVADQEFEVRKTLEATPMSKYRDPADPNSYEPKGDFRETPTLRAQPTKRPPAHSCPPQKPQVVPLKTVPQPAPRPPEPPKERKKREPKAKVAGKKVLGPRAQIRQNAEELRRAFPNLPEKEIKKMAKQIGSGASK